MDVTEHEPAPLTVPLSLMQQEIWDWLERWPKSKELFNDTIRLTLPGQFDPDLVHRVLSYIVQRHEPLRTTFHSNEEGETYQSIAPVVPVDLAVADLTGLEPSERQEELLRRIAAQDAEPIDVTTGPLFRVSLYKMSEQSSELAITTEHIISDQTTDSILYGELLEVHAALRRGDEPDLPDLPIQFADFAIWQRQWLTAERLQSGCDYWREQLRGIPLLGTLPWDRPRTLDGSKRTSCIDFIVPEETQAGLERVTVETKSTLFIVTTAAAQALLAQYTSETDVVVLTTFHGRDRPELEGLMGIFAGVGLIRSDLSGDPTFERIVERTRSAVLGMLEHQYVPFDKVMGALVGDLRTEGIDTIPRPAPLSVEFFHAATGRLISGMSLIARCPEAEGHISADSPDVHDTINPLALRIFGGSRMWGRLSYHEAVFDRSTVERLVAEYKTLLGTVTRDAQVRFSALPPVGADRLGAV